jgi:hypothetical protein
MIKLCKNGCNKEVYRGRLICQDCVKREVRENYAVKKDAYNKARRVGKIYSGKCDYCTKSFETNKHNQKFCCTRHQQLWHYERQTFYQKTRKKALLNIYDRGKKKFSSVNYTKKDVKYIIKNYEKISNIEIAHHLGRTVQGINLKIGKLKQELLIVPKDFF